MEAHPVKTAWVGHFWQFGEKTAVEFDNIVFGFGEQISGGGEDAIGKFELKGEYTASSVKFSKTYTTGEAVGQGLLLYEGDMYPSAEGMKITGQYSFPGAEDSAPPDRFEILRSKEIEEKRDAAFKSVVAGMKFKVGMFRFFTEDFWMHIMKGYYVLTHLHGGLIKIYFTIISLVAGVLMNLAGPFLEARVARAMAQASAGTSVPSISDGSERKSQRSSKRSGGQDRSGYRRRAEDNRHIADYEQKLIDTKVITTTEYFTGNVDYIAALMENPQPAEVVDISICDVIIATPLVGNGLLLTSAVFWMYTLAFPFLFDVTCGSGAPATAHLVFCLTAFCNVFVQIWCASLTKFGYLMLVHAPQMYFFDTALSVLGLFSSYSSVVWIVDTKACGCWIWKPAAAVYLIGMILFQAAPGLYLLWSGEQLPMALRLTQNNLLITLLKPNP